MFHLLGLVLILFDNPMAEAKGSTRIVGGESTSIEMHPYIASLRTAKYKHFCAGSIITSSAVLTAAHCLYGLDGNRDPDELKVVVGETYKRGARIKFDVQWLKMPENYHSQMYFNDIGLVKIRGHFLYSNRVRPIKVSSELHVPPGIEATVSGWGGRRMSADKNVERGNISLQEVSVPIISNGECRRLYADVRHKVIDSMICAQHPRRGKGHCKGDSGGPLVINSELVGIVSWQYGCAYDKPGVYTRVAWYLEWIESNKD